ncbi:PDZ and LIM domain protein 3 [Condylostylus longicornis]|uniref:PDZ and LIM domain protein 3 n=1 Tax=Condylostylus longicornis TaxID=2530218 RepID=UPI00244DCCFA|nr:PDZ and LIM domain protein 3 [Condylostylus longicornis]
MVAAKEMGHITVPKYTSDAFNNVEYELRISYTVETDKRIMSFVDILWGMEVTGGIDQFEPLTIVNVTRAGLARRAGMRVGDVITAINDTPAEELTLMEAQRLIRESGKYVRIYVRGDVDRDSDDELTVDFWFKPRKPWRKDFEPINWVFPWNDRRKPVYRESNCFMVPSKVEEFVRSKRSATSNVVKKHQSLTPGRSVTPMFAQPSTKPTTLAP